MEAEERQEILARNTLPSESVQIGRRSTEEVNDQSGKSWESGRLEFKVPVVSQAVSVLHFTLVQFNEIKKEGKHGTAPIHSHRH